MVVKHLCFIPGGEEASLKENQNSFAQILSHDNITAVKLSDVLKKSIAICRNKFYEHNFEQTKTFK
jgi:hypothetical protein